MRCSRSVCHVSESSWIGDVSAFRPCTYGIENSESRTASNFAPPSSIYLDSMLGAREAVEDDAVHAQQALRTSETTMTKHDGSPSRNSRVRARRMVQGSCTRNAVP